MCTLERDTHTYPVPASTLPSASTNNNNHRVFNRGGIHYGDESNLTFEWRILIAVETRQSENNLSCRPTAHRHTHTHTHTLFAAIISLATMHCYLITS